MSETDLELRLSWVGAAGVLVSALALGVGLVLYVARRDAPLSETLLQTGIVVLMLTPAWRVLLSTAERVRRRDRTFVLVTLVVLLELALAAVLASRRV